MAGSGEKHDSGRAANILGALALMVTDRMTDAVEQAAGQVTTGATALSALRHFLREPSIDLLRQVLGITHSGTVRLVDRLQDAGYVKRGAGADGRIINVRLTPAGRRASARVAEARAAVLRESLVVLTPGEQQQLADLAGRVLVGMRREPGATRWGCRLCDTGACGRADGRCPVAGPNPPMF
jgi:MarR family transcriptional repressor of emrRAB